MVVALRERGAGSWELGARRGINRQAKAESSRQAKPTALMKAEVWKADDPTGGGGGCGENTAFSPKRTAFAALSYGFI